MKKLHIAAITVSGLAAAMVGLAAHASPTELPTVSPIVHWYRIPPLDRRLPADRHCPEGRHQRAPQRPLTLSSTQGHPSAGAPLRAGARPGQPIQSRAPSLVLQGCGACTRPQGG